MSAPRFWAALLGLGVAFAANAEPAPARAPREALQPFNVLVGSWHATGIPEGTREEKQKGSWGENLEWGWQFKGADAWLAVKFEKSKHFTKGELRYLPKEDRYQFRLETTGKETLTFAGKLADKRLTLERTDEAKKEVQRLVVSLLHHNRFLYRYEVKPVGRSYFTKVYQVGATKDGESFASVGSPERECIVSGGQGTMAVTYQGKTYYVCCSGCRDEFKENPEKYVREFEAKRNKQKKDGK